MAYDQQFAQICAQVNSSLEVQQLMDYTEWKADKVVKSGDVYLAFCPIHKDEVFRTLVLNPRNNTYHCRHVHCPGNRASDFLDLLVRCFERPLPHVIRDLVARFGAEFFRLSDRQLSIIDKKVKELEETGPRE